MSSCIIYLYISLPIYLSINLYVSVLLSIYLSVFTSLSFYLSIYVSLYFLTHPPAYLSIYPLFLYIHLLSPSNLISITNDLTIYPVTPPPLQVFLYLLFFTASLSPREVMFSKPGPLFTTLI